jgi:hypothetical protein
VNFNFQRIFNPTEKEQEEDRQKYKKLHHKLALDQFEDAVENGEGRFFYSKDREIMCNMPSEKIMIYDDPAGRILFDGE